VRCGRREPHTEAWGASVRRDSVTAYEMACCVPAENCDREAHAQYVLHVCFVLFSRVLDVTGV
jgi:hypothetical protein